MKKLFPVLLLLISLSIPAAAQIMPSNNPAADSIAINRMRARMDSIRQYRPTVALVLAGGGARGLAHLGVIRLVEELGIPVDLVTGTSMGGLVAGLYSMGYNHRQLDSLVRAINWPVMMSDDIPDEYISYRVRKFRDQFVLRVPFHYDQKEYDERLRAQYKEARKWNKSRHQTTADVSQEAFNQAAMGLPDGYLFGLNVRNQLSSVTVGYQDSLSFMDLPIPFVCVATDMYQNKPKYWADGNVVDALRSTMAIPFYFRSVHTDGTIYLDGGMRNNFPADIAKEMGADIIIGSDMMTDKGINDLHSPIQIVFQLINLLSSESTTSGLLIPDVRINHKLAGFNMLSFDEQSVNTIIEQGYENALSHKAELESVAEQVAGKAMPPVHRPAVATDISLQKIKVSEISFEGISERESKRIIPPYFLPKDGIYDRETIERIQYRLYGTRAFESISYRIEGTGEPYRLVFVCQHGQQNEIALGIHSDNDEMVYLVTRLGIGTRKYSGGYLTTDIKVGNCPKFNLEAGYRPANALPSVGARLWSQYIGNDFVARNKGVMDKLFSIGSDLFIEDSRMTVGEFRLGVTADMDPFEHYLSIVEEWRGWDWDSYTLSAFLNFRIDTFDDAYFPGSGVRFFVKGRHTFAGHSIDLMSADPETGLILDASGKMKPYTNILGHLSAAFPIGNSFTVIPSFYAGWNSLDNDWMNPKHRVVAGGTMAGRYLEHQMPFFGYSTNYRQCDRLSGVAQLDLRYRLGSTFLTARGALLQDSSTIQGFFTSPEAWAAGLEVGRQTALGPLKLGASWCNVTGFVMNASFGFEF